MHRALSIIVPSEATDSLLEELRDLDGVITLTVHRGDGVKPRGDVINAAVLNTAADVVVQHVSHGQRFGSVSITTEGIDSLIDSEHLSTVRGDFDEAMWEDSETAMRRHTRPNLNFFLTTAAGGVAAGCGLVCSSGVTEATALVAAGIIAPAFEPLARLGLGLVGGHLRTALDGARGALLSYATLIAAALLTMLALRSGSHSFVGDFIANTTVHEVEHPPAINLILSAVGAIAGVIMVAAGRFTQLAGPLVALQLLPAAATVGVALEIGDGTGALDGIGRLGIDVAMVLLAALIVFTYKRVAVHGHRGIAR